jgi:hypothetical protein
MTAMDQINGPTAYDQIRTDNVNVSLFLSHFEGFLSDGAIVSD